MNQTRFILLLVLLYGGGWLKAQTLVWEENFNAATINTSTWKYDMGDGCDRGICGWGNSELEYYTDRSDNARIENGNLVIEARRENYLGKSFTSARLKTEGLVQFKYGTVEARIKVPDLRNGLWPAFWTLGSVGGVWPAIGEIDMVEMGISGALSSGVGNKRVSSATHWSQAGSHQYYTTYTDAAVDLSADFHLYKMVWTSQYIKMYLDNVEYYSFDISGAAAADLSEFHHPHYLLLNLAVGGSYTGILSESGITAPFPGQMLVDYIKLYQNPGDELFVLSNNPTPLTAAPTPTKPQADVISLFSNAYTNVPVDTWSAPWDAADVSDVQIQSNDTKLYQNLSYAGVEFTSNLIDASAQTHLHLDIWTPNSTSFKVKLVDFGANAAYQGSPNDDSEHELTFTQGVGSWISYDIPLQNFTNLTARSHLAQLVLSGSSNSTIYIDNVYFYKDNTPTAPLTAAPTPTKPQADVISLFSNAYTNVPVDTWSAPWDAADVSDVQIQSNDNKLYQNLVFAGVEFTSNLIDASAQTHLHLDIWTPNSANFKVKLVDFGANGSYQGSPNDDSEHELSFTPANGSWVSYDIPLSSFTNLTARAHLAQLIISGSNSTVYVDNVYFYKDNTPTTPLTAAPTPTKPQADVISLFSNAYTNVPVDTWSAPWDAADVSDVQIQSNDNKLYQNLVFAGVEFTSNLIDASAQTHLHLDIWTPNSTSFKVKLVDFGANAAYQGSPNDDSEHELSFTPANGSWVSYDIPLSSFTNLTARAHLAQLIISGSNSTVYVDNVYFYKDNTPTTPLTAAPTPTKPQADVISLFSNAYTNVPVDTWSAPWDAADVSDVQIQSNDNKLYQNLVFAGVEFTSNLIDASAQTHLHLDIWTPNSTSFKVKLVDFGANGSYQGSPNDDSEHELSFTPANGSWVSYDIPLSSFTNLTARAHLAQLIISGSNSTVYVDNVYFYKDNTPTTPLTAAPTPTKPQADVISLFSNAYTNVPVDTWSAPWDAADVSDVQIQSNDNKLYQNLVFAGVEFTSNLIDASAQTHLHLDIWTPNSTSFKVKLVDFGANASYQGSPNDDSEHELSFTPANGSWVSYDIPLSSFTNLTARAHLAQLIISGSNSTVYVDNVYFYNDSPCNPPIITCPANQNITLGSFECNKEVTFNAPSVSSTCTTTLSRTDTLTYIQSGSSLSAGVYDLKYQVRDASGNTANCTFKITINGQQTTGRLVCVPSLEVSLSNRECTQPLDVRQLLTDNTYHCVNAYSLAIANRISNTITSADLGKTLSVSVRDNLNSSCTSLIKVIDKQAPVLSTPQDMTIYCGDISKNNTVLADVSEPTVISECSGTKFTYQDKVLTPLTGQSTFGSVPSNFPIDKSFNYSLGTASSKIIVRTYTATDDFNNSSTTQRVIYVKNIELTDVVCPKDITLRCENGNFNASVTTTGTPQLSNSGRSLQDVSCAIDYFYSDTQESNGQGYIIKRAWTLINRNTQARQTCTQTITVLCAPAPLLAISGSINKETGESIAATVRLSNATTELGTQQLSAYQFSNLPSNNLYRVRPEKDNDILNGVTTFDISRISKHILGIQPFTSPYQMIAADVNKDGSIDGADIIYIRNVLLKRLSRFPNNSSWRFVPKNYTFTDATNPFNEDFPEILSWNPLNQNVTQGDFVAIKIGDVNLSSQSNIQAPVERSQNVQYIDIQDFKISAGEEYTLNLNLNERSLTALQMALKVNKTHLDLLKVNKGDLPQFDNSNIELNRDKAFIASVWYNSSNSDLKDENTLIRLTVKPKKAIWVHELLVIDSDEMVNVAYNTEGVEKTLELRFKAAEIQSPNFELHQNRPNPFTNETTISFVLPEQGSASIEVYDLTGRAVYHVKKEFNKGYNELILDNKMLPTDGVYFYRLQSESFSATKKMQMTH